MKGGAALEPWKVQPGAVVPPTTFALATLVACTGCDRPLQPSWAPDGQRLYAFLCGCRREPAVAELVERLARDKVEAESPSLVAGLAVEQLGLVLTGIFAQVRIGSPDGDLEFVWRL